MPAIEELSPRQAHQLIDTNPRALLVCAYEEEDQCRQNMLEQAISLDQLRRRRDSLPTNEPIVFYCDCPHEEASKAQAAKYFKEGFANVKVLKGGIRAWREAGYGVKVGH